MHCANCTYYEEGICYRNGVRVSFNNNICEKFIYVNNGEFIQFDSSEEWEKKNI